jgi:hypothetical protein
MGIVRRRKRAGFARSVEVRSGGRHGTVSCAAEERMRDSMRATERMAC